MQPELVDALWRELELRGYREGMAPNDSMRLSRAQVAQDAVSGLLIAMVVRRQKVCGSSATVGDELARKACEDVEIAVAAISAVVERFLREGSKTDLPQGMSPELVEALWRELELRGYSEAIAPNGSTWFSKTQLAQREMSALLIAMVVRRQKIYGTAADVDTGEDQARKHIEDAEIAVAAVASVMEMSLASETSPTTEA